MSTKLVDRGWQKIYHNMKKLKNTEIVVGILGAEARLTDGKSDATLADIAVYNHFGTKHIPARPFLQNAVDQNQAEILKRLKGSLKLISEGQVSPETQLNRIGAYLVGLVQREITDLRTPPNAPATIRKKKSDNPLIDTGRLRQSVTFEIRY